MKIEHNTAGINPTAEFIRNQHTGKFIEILPGTYLIKGAKNERGFNQGYALSNNKRKELILIDVVEEATREAVKIIVKDEYVIKAIVITGKAVLNDAYADLETISEEAGGAEILLPPDIQPDTDFKIQDASNNSSLIKEFQLEILQLPAAKNGEILLYSGKNQGMLFAGSNAKGSSYDDDTFIFTREKQEKQNEEFELSKYWQSLRKDFYYFFPRIGKPAIEVDGKTRSNILNWLSRGGS